MPDEETPPAPPAPPTNPPQAEAEAKFTDEWHASVEKRFNDLGEFIRSGRASHATTESPSAAAPTQAQQGQPTPVTPPDGQGPVGGNARDTRPPKPNHIWFRRIGG